MNEGKEGVVKENKRLSHPYQSYPKPLLPNGNACDTAERTARRRFAVKPNRQVERVKLTRNSFLNH